VFISGEGLSSYERRKQRLRDREMRILMRLPGI
jgi:hypothetical protein